jgi:hypothetical protein
MTYPADLDPQTDFPSGLSRPALRALASARLTRLKHLTRLTEADLLALHGMGPKGIRTLRAALQTKGWDLKGS